MEETIKDFNHNETIIKRVAYGHVQKRVARMLLNGKVVKFSTDICQGYTIYYNSYKDSILNLLNRLEKEGIETEIIKGEHGGFWNALIRKVDNNE